MAAKKKVSVRFIAAQCGVSTATVSRVINNDDSVTDATRRRVLQVLEQYHYEAPAAPAPKVSKVGVVIVSSRSDYYHAVLGGIGRWFRDRGTSTIAINTEGVSGYLPTALDTLYDSNVQGVILVSCDYLAVREHLHSKIPHVWIDCNDRPDATAGICQVQSDQYVSGKLAAQELLSKGCKKPIVLTGAHATHRSDDLLNGFRNEFAANGITVEHEQIVALPDIKEYVTESQEMIRYLVTKGFAFDGVFATSDERALGAYMGVVKMGLTVPDGVRIVGFDGISDACTEVLNITCVQQNVQLLTRYACEMLMRLIAREAICDKRVVVPTNILPGQTT
ncbi:MAG: LacI family DNA-binding transcriptional regulator [Oscillospiraceae bacterium]|nr:LacI family DNA-binding transcriptional regulator [Oscillospiraceae bacterium]